VPLSDLAIETIRSMPRVHNELVFPARGKDNPVSGYSKWKSKLDQISGVKDWTLHDLRRTAATGMASLKVPLHVIELVLNHRAKSLSGVAGIYNRHEYLDDQRAALERWARHVESLALKAQGSVEEATAARAAPTKPVSMTSAS
jgi:integrase